MSTWSIRINSSIDMRSSQSHIVWWWRKGKWCRRLWGWGSSNWRKSLRTGWPSIEKSTQPKMKNAHKIIHYPWWHSFLRSSIYRAIFTAIDAVKLSSVANSSLLGTVDSVTMMSAASAWSRLTDLYINHSHKSVDLTVTSRRRGRRSTFFDPLGRGGIFLRR